MSFLITAEVRGETAQGDDTLLANLALHLPPAVHLRRTAQRLHNVVLPTVVASGSLA